jgi:SNF2 family DNA or RNA helicase
MISSKTRVLLELLAEFGTEDRSTLVFSAFTRHLDRIAEALKAKGIAYRMLTGAHSQAERRDCIDAFQSGQVKVLLVSLKAGGTALNLTKASAVIFMDPWWNPAVEDQAADRAHRFGQTRPVTVIRIVAKGTIEGKVLDLHERKRGLLDGVLDDGDVAARLTGKELMALVRSGGGERR